MKDLLLIKQPSPLRIGIVAVLREYFNIDVRAYGAAEEAAIKQSLDDVDLVLIDLDTQIDLISMIELCKKKNRKVIVWTSAVSHPLLLKTFKMKLNGYFYNGMESQELIEAVQYVENGHVFIHPSLSSVLLEDYASSDHLNETPKPVGLLTRREWEVMELITKGYSNEQIGTTLYISEKTVKNHVSAILKKFQVMDRTNAVLMVLKKRWITL